MEGPRSGTASAVWSDSGTPQSATARETSGNAQIIFMKIPVICSTLLIEKSPQALPLGAACIASAIKHCEELRSLVDAGLMAFCLEDKDFPKDKKQAAEYIACRLIEKARGEVNGGSEAQAIFCFSCFVWNVEILESAAKILRSKGFVCIAGGPEITAHPSFYKGFDYCVSGEGEVSVPRLINSILQKAKESKKSDSVIISTSPELSGLNSPYLDGIIDPAVYGGALWELARGCPFKCSYCYESKGEKTVRLFPLERIKAELELFERKKIPQVFVLDPTYNVNKKRALELLKLIREKTPHTFYYFEARAEFIDRELAREFTKIPCALQIGLQSVNEEVLKLINRPWDKKKFLKGISFLNEEGVTFGLDLIFGLPGEGFASFKNGMDFAFSLFPNNLEVFCLSILPGTDLYDRADALGVIYQKTPPYHVIKSKELQSDEILRLEKLAKACFIFYNEGRAVPWFVPVCKCLKINGTKLLEIFYEKKLDGKKEYENCCEHKVIEKLQLDFLSKLFSERKMERYFKAAEDIIKFYGAISRTTEGGKSEIVQLNYNAEYVASDYASDIRWFAENIKPQKSKIQTFINKGRADFRFIK